MTDTITSQTILVVDDDRSSRAFLADNLTADGYEVLEAGTMAAAQRLLASSALDLAIVDLGLPDGDGLELLRLVRDSAQPLARIDASLPMILTSERDSAVDRLRGFERGCDDYITTPYSYPELRARVVALLRRRRPVGTLARLRVGPLEVDALARQAWLDGELVTLSSKEFALLRVLVSEPQRVFTREELLRVVWGWDEATAATAYTRTLDSHASRLRRKLAGEGMRFVINVWGVGYRLIDGVPEAAMASGRLPYAAGRLSHR
jgi:DNA-binding response OmpR family regulator